MSARRPALADGAIVAMLAAPVAADECSDYRAGFVLSEAASRASREHSAQVAEDMAQFDGRHRPEYGEAELRAHLDDNALQARRRGGCGPDGEGDGVQGRTPTLRTRHLMKPSRPVAAVAARDSTG